MASETKLSKILREASELAKKIEDDKKKTSDDEKTPVAEGEAPADADAQKKKDDEEATAKEAYSNPNSALPGYKKEGENPFANKVTTGAKDDEKSDGDDKEPDGDSDDKKIELKKEGSDILPDKDDKKDDEDADSDGEKKTVKEGEKPCDDEEDEVKKADPKEMKEHIEALFAGQSLTEDFQIKAAVIFEAAVNERVEIAKTELSETYNRRLARRSDLIEQDLAAKVDSYLNYVVKEWITENKIALENGIRNEICENFIGGLRNLFLENNVEVPADKNDIVEGLAAKVESLTASLNEQYAGKIALSEEINKLKKEQILTESTKGLSDVQASRLRKLTEGVDFSNEKSYATKVKVLRETVESGKGLGAVTKSDAKTDKLITEAVEGDGKLSTQTNSSKEVDTTPDFLKAYLQKSAQLNSNTLKI